MDVLARNVELFKCYKRNIIVVFIFESLPTFSFPSDCVLKKRASHLHFVFCLLYELLTSQGKNVGFITCCGKKEMWVGVSLLKKKRQKHC